MKAIVKLAARRAAASWN